ncbi:hypothetical protein OQA88_7716 [Cercophora sp. LCS_1]
MFSVGDVLAVASIAHRLWNTLDTLRNRPTDRYHSFASLRRDLEQLRRNLDMAEKLVSQRQSDKNVEDPRQQPIQDSVRELMAVLGDLDRALQGDDMPLDIQLKVSHVRAVISEVNCFLLSDFQPTEGDVFDPRQHMRVHENREEPWRTGQSWSEFRSSIVSEYQGEHLQAERVRTRFEGLHKRGVFRRIFAFLVFCTGALSSTMVGIGDFLWEQDGKDPMVNTKNLPQQQDAEDNKMNGIIARVLTVVPFPSSPLALIGTMAIVIGSLATYRFLHRHEKYQPTIVFGFLAVGILIGKLTGLDGTSTVFRVLPWCVILGLVTSTSFSESMADVVDVDVEEKT